MKIRTRQAIGKQNRARGQAFERTVAKELAKVWPEARRNLSQTRTAKKEGGDILYAGGYFVECKSSKKVDPFSAWEAAFEDNETPGPVVLVYRDGRTLMACLVVVTGATSSPLRHVLGCVRLSSWLAAQ